MRKICAFCTSCGREARIHYVLTSGEPVWYCIEHYDLMVKYYQEQVDKDQTGFARDMVRANKW